jgi:retron-type reverse transcriptase
MSEATDTRQKWKTVNRLLHPCQEPDGNESITPGSFADYFVNKITDIRSAIAAQLSSVSIPLPDPPFTGHPLDSLPCVTAAEVQKFLLSMPSKSSNQDFVPTSLLKSCHGVFSHLIAHLANISFSQASFPSRFKTATVKPILKKPGLDKSVLFNYRPISNLNNISKVLERLFLVRFQPHVTSTPNYNPQQSAYRRGYSTETALIRMLDDVYTAADNGKATMLLSLDLSAAFDTIDHHILVERLRVSFGVTGAALAWISSYLTNRSQAVQIGADRSNVSTCSFGVPQGSVLGPILFAAYVSPMATIAQSHCTLQQQYADDTQLYIFLSATSLASQLSHLQSCIASIQSWCIQNGLALNPTKTDAICLGTSGRIASLGGPPALTVSGTSISPSADIKLLGVTLDSNLTFGKHVTHVCQSVFYHIRAFRHIRHFLDDETAKTVAVAVVGSRLDYANSVLYGAPAVHIQRLQRLQNSLARVVLRAGRLCSGYAHKIVKSR